jgi:hypothetical protein
VRELTLLSAIACVALGLAWIYEADFFAIWRWRPRDIGETPELVSYETTLQVLTNTIYRFKPIGLEAGPLSQWLYSVLAEAGLPVICVETRHMRAVGQQHPKLLTA